MTNSVDGSSHRQAGKHSGSKFQEYARSILLAFALFLIVRICVAQPFEIPSGSMKNTLLVGDYLLVNKFIYGVKIPFTNLRLPEIRPPERGDVVVFKFPLNRSEDYIKRVIGIPGDVISIRDKVVSVNGIPYQNPHAIHTDPYILPRSIGIRDNFGPVRVPPNSYFVMGDNRDNSYDSRYWGFVKADDIVGEAFIKYWSWNQKTWRPRWGRIGQPIN